MGLYYFEFEFDRSLLGAELLVATCENAFQKHLEMAKGLRAVLDKERFLTQYTSTGCRYSE